MHLEIKCKGLLSQNAINGDKAGGCYAPAESLWLLAWAIPYWRIL